MEVRLPFVLDTGTERTIVEVRVAEKLGFLPRHIVQPSRVSFPLGVEEGDVVRTPRLHALGWERDDSGIACHQLAAKATVAGLLGADFFPGPVLTINDAAGIVGLSEPEHPTQEGRRAVAAPRELRDDGFDGRHRLGASSRRMTLAL
jgi:hypothetical protein